MATAPDESVIKPDHNALGKAAFIMGLIGLLFSFIPIIGFVAWLLAPLAILFGLIALLRPSRSLAIAGILTGALALFVCFAWVKGTQSVGEAMTADTFNNDGKAVDLSKAPVKGASIKEVWVDMEANKIAAGKKYGGHRLLFTDEVIEDFSGDAANPQISFVGEDGEYLIKLVTAAFSAADGDKIGGLKKGSKTSFLCEEVSETFGDGYSLSKCSLK